MTVKKQFSIFVYSRTSKFRHSLTNKLQLLVTSSARLPALPLYPYTPFGDHRRIVCTSCLIRSSDAIKRHHWLAEKNEYNWRAMNDDADYEMVMMTMLFMIGLAVCGSRQCYTRS